MGTDCNVSVILETELTGIQVKIVHFKPKNVFISGGQLKTQPDQESLSAGWFDVDDIRGGRVDLRSSDFFKIVNEAMRFRQWRLTIPAERFKPILNGDVTQPGLFIEFVIVKQGAVS